MLATPNARIGDVLRQCGMVDERQLDEAQAYARAEGIRIGEALVAMGVLDRDRLAWALGVQFDLAYVDLDPDAIDWEFVMRFPLARLRELRLLPMSYAGGVVHAVIADPSRAKLEGVVDELFAGRELVVQLAAEERILALLGEAKRRQQTPHDAFAPPPKIEDAAAWLDDCIEMLGKPDGEHSFVVLEQDARRPHQYRILRPVADPPTTPVPAGLVRALLDLLSERFVEDVPVAGGFGGLAPAMFAEDGTARRAAVRATSLSGALGRVLVFERIPETPATAGNAWRVRTNNVARAKAALARLCAVSFEAHIDCVPCTPTHRFAIAAPPFRSILCRRVAPALGAGRTLWEAVSPAEAEFAPFGFVDGLVVVQRDPDAREDVVEAIGDSPASAADELRAALAEAAGA